MLSYFLVPDLRLLAIRYGWATAIKVGIVWLWGSDWASVLREVLPSPWRVFGEFGFFLSSIVRLLTGDGGIIFTTLWLGSALQLLFFLGLLRWAILTYAPHVLRDVPVIGLPDGDRGELAGLRLRRPWWVVPAFMAFSTVFMCYFVTGVVTYLARGRSQWRMFGPSSIGEAMDAAGPWPFYVALGLTALGLAWGWRYVQRTKLALGEGFGVQYLAPDHWLTQRVHGLAARLDLPPPAVGIMRQVNAYACGPSPNQAAVIIGAPLVKAFTPAELDAVIGHELGHVVSGDMRQMQFAEGFQSMFGNVFGVAISVAGIAGASAAKDRSTAAAVRMGTSAASQIARVLIAFISELMVKGLSRNREFYADAVGAALSSPEAMSSALDKIHKVAAKPTDVESAYGYLMFRGSSFGRLFSTHPTMDQRRAALERGTYLRTLPRKTK